MATKKTLIRDIKALTDDENIVDGLNSMNKGELEQLLEYLEKVNVYEKEKSLDTNENYGEDLTEEFVEDAIVNDVDEPVFLPESEWSMADKRLFARTGRKPVKKK